ncbi:MAG: Arabinose 5-phosphate isomerase KdsD [Alphaproteobacteria bacterium MarineAlpha2_Bin1]|nr:MAG: Arabinose 5-phosphate isomerase KdsD [Alphaproteobacteria bacterium MarineAlpha2_Bin1]|tara:strand:+ start:172 stop:1146 length:975 start_codon:yes stop_codon:yes gene_type:complete
MKNKNQVLKLDYLEIGKKVLIDESKGIVELASNLGNEFIEVINCLKSINGRFIFSGVGKSGHIAKKISSTLSSTGSPSHFLHPTEASHGDLGILTDIDCLIIFSKSGESYEINDILSVAKNLSIPIIAICANSKSTLVKSSTHFLKIPKIPEAGNLALAPTTSSTMMLSLGDAIAIALLEAKNFSSDDFQKFHPGGRLGMSLLKVSDLMHTKESVPIVNTSSLMSEVLLAMSSKNFGCACVVDEKLNLVGSITDGDLRRHIDKDLLERKAIDIMSKSPKTIDPTAYAIDAIKKMVGSITSLFVVENNKVIGLLRLHDCIRAGLN